MRVTDDMIERLRAVLIECMEVPPGRVASQAALEAVLADVPDFDFTRAALEATAARMKAAETKLEKVRAALVEHSPSKALAILDKP